jgi:hypothetical protein
VPVETLRAVIAGCLTGGAASRRNALGRARLRSFAAPAVHLSSVPAANPCALPCPARRQRGKEQFPLAVLNEYATRLMQQVSRHPLPCWPVALLPLPAPAALPPLACPRWPAPALLLLPDCLQTYLHSYLPACCCCCRRRRRRRPRIAPLVCRLSSSWNRSIGLAASGWRHASQVRAACLLGCVTGRTSSK